MITIQVGTEPGIKDYEIEDDSRLLTESQLNAIEDLSDDHYPEYEDISSLRAEFQLEDNVFDLDFEESYY